MIDYQIMKLQKMRQGWVWEVKLFNWGNRFGNLEFLEIYGVIGF